MARSEITGKRKLLAQNVSHSNIKTKRWQHVNIQTRRLWVPELSRFVTVSGDTTGAPFLSCYLPEACFFCLQSNIGTVMS